MSAVRMQLSAAPRQSSVRPRSPKAAAAPWHGNTREDGMRATGILAAACVAAAATTASATTASAADFYAGKTIDFIIGSNPGGGYDVYARALARHIVNHIPGKPQIIPKNLPGAGSGKAAAYMQTLAPKDGLALGAVFPGALMEPLLGNRAKAQYDPPKFQYIGTSDSGTRICAIWHASKTKTFEDAQKQKTVLGASQAGGSSRDYGYLHNHLNGAKFDVISGYKGSVDIMLAVERGEVDGMCGYDWSSLRTQRAHWIRDKKINIIVQVALEPHEELTKMGVPTIWKFIKNEEDKKVAELIVTQQVFGRPYFVPAGPPADRVQLLREAFDKTMKDPAFLEDAKKQRLDIQPLGGARLQKMIEDMYASPAKLVERARAAVKP
jgi:tripartite-type tricarboxylate transporter receptor subunit TctC